MTEAEKANPRQQANSVKDDLSKITRLVNAGLLPREELPALKTALVRRSKVDDIAKLPRNQRLLIQKFETALNSAALGSNQSYTAVRRNINAGFELDRDDFISESINETVEDPPMMMVLKRKAIRIFPDGQRVALYVNDKLGLTFTIPYTPGSVKGDVIGVQEEVSDVIENIEHLKDMAAKGESRALKFLDGTSMEVNHELAKKILMIHDQLKDENKAKLIDTITKSKGGFLKVANFAHNAVKPAVPNAK